ncbi:MAG TPA: hypothetical protein VJU83_10675 [Burkholderiales bacterium]|nr:hypothetical protein [Burkholderiales bacterium]
MHLQLAIPDLIWPDTAFTAANDLPLPALLQLLSKGRLHSAQVRDTDSWLLEAFGVPSAGEAPYSLRADGGDPGDGTWLRADPCHLQVNRDHVVLADSKTFQIDRNEAEAMVESLNQLFASDGMRFYPMQPDRWYVRLSNESPIETTPLLQVRGKDIDPFLPRGPQAMQWRRMLNEAQMLLHAHPVNDAREARGAAPINSIWLWGEGASPTPMRKFQRVRTHNPLAAGLAQSAGASVYPVPEDASQWLKAVEDEGTELILLESLSAAACYGDLHTWQSELQVLEEKWFAPLRDALRAGQFGMLSVHSMGLAAAFSIEVTRQDLRYFWRRQKALRYFADTDAA